MGPSEVECPLVHQKLRRLVEQANQHWSIIGLDGKGEPLCSYEEVQYAVYGPGQHFNAWHQDAFEKGNDPEAVAALHSIVCHSIYLEIS